MWALTCVWFHWLCDNMVPSLFRLTTKTTKAPHYWLFAMIVHHRPMDSHYKSFKYHGGIIKDTSIWALTHWGRVTHICVVKLTIIGSDNGLSPGRRQAIIWTNTGILLIGPLGTNFGIQTSSFKKMHSKMSSAKRRPFCLGLNMLRGVVSLVTRLFIQQVI